MTYLACPAANPAIASAVLVCYSLACQTPPTTRTVGGGVWHASDGCLCSWGAYFRMGANTCEDLVRTEMGAYIHGVLNIQILRYV